MGHMEEMKNAYKILIGKKNWSKDRLGVPQCRSEIGVLMWWKCGLDTAATGGLSLVKATMSLHAV